MKFIIIFGPSAVGKMTVGYELAKLTGLKLFHNHMTIDFVSQFFDWGKPGFELVDEFRLRVFEKMANSDQAGLIFTYVWALDDDRDNEFIENSHAIFSQQGAAVYFVELYAGLNERLKRNKTEFRLSKKEPKRDLKRSEELLLRDEQHIMNSNDDFIYPDKHLKIDNTDLSAADVAQQIVTHFNLDKDNA